MTNTMEENTNTEIIGDEETSITTNKEIEKKKRGLFTDEKGNLKIVNFVCRYPVRIFFGIWLFSISISIGLLVIVLQNGNPFASPSNEYDIKDVRSIAYDSFRLARDEVQKERMEQEKGQILRTQQNNLDVTYWVFESESDKGLFSSAESINQMKETCDLFASHEEYQNYCWRAYVDSSDSSDSNSSTTTDSFCRAPSSALNMYFSSTWDSETAQSIINQLQNPMNVEKYNALALCVEVGAYCDLIPDGIATDYNMDWADTFNKNVTSMINRFDGKGETLVQDFHQVTLLAASLMQLNTKKGYVDFGYDKHFSIHNPVSKYSRVVIKWGSPLPSSVNPTHNSEEDKDYLKDFIVDNFLSDMNELSKKKHSEYFNAYYFMDVLRSEILYDTIARDSYLAIASFFLVFLFIRKSVGSWFLAIVGRIQIVLSIPVAWFIFEVVYQIKYFSILNVLCLFIVAAIGGDDIFIFMDAYKLSAYAGPDVVESLESRMSWVYRRAGSAMAITSATTCAAFLSTLITPLVGVQAFGIFAATVIFINYILVMTLYCTAVVIYHDRFEAPGCSCSFKMVKPTSTEKAIENLLDPNGERQPEDKVSVFFRTRFAGTILNFKARIVIAFVFTTWIAVSAYFTSQLEPTKESEQFLNENHPLQKSTSILASEFPTSEEDDGLNIYFTLGIEDVDRSGVNQLLDPEFFGEATYSRTFDFNEKCQANMLHACEMLKINKEYANHIKQEGGLGAVKCWVEEFAAFSALGTLNDCNAVKMGKWKNESWQVPSSDVPQLFANFTEQKSCFSDDSELINSFYKDTLGLDAKSSLKYASFSLESSVLDPLSNKPREVVRTEYDAMISLAEILAEQMEGVCRAKIYMTDTDSKFVFMNNQDIYIESALQSAILGVVIAFAVLLLSTKVLHLSLLATLNIGGVLVSVTGIMVMLDWSLGTVESILISIVAGFSVDYIVHIAHAYEKAHGTTADRLRTAFGEMGISVFNGMTTSFVASIPLFFCELQFYSKFGAFMCVTIAFAWLFANFVFTAVLAQLRIRIKRDKGCRF